MKSIIIVTNNPMVIEKYGDHQIIIKQSAVEVLCKARDLIHIGHQLLNHPLAGSVKPNETPYRSLMLTQGVGELDYTSLSHIEAAMAKYQQFLNDLKISDLPEKILKDFQLIDFTLFESGYEAIIT